MAKRSGKKASPLTKVLNGINKKQPFDYNKKDVGAFVITNVLSEHHDLLEILNEINPLHFSLTDELIIKYYVEKIPSGSRYKPMTKKGKDDITRENGIGVLMDKFDLSRREAGLSYDMERE